MVEEGLQNIRRDLIRMGRLGSRQLRGALRAFEKLDLIESEKIIEGDDVFDALNLSIEEKSYGLAGREFEEEEKRFLRSAVKVSSNLERVGDAACHIARRVSIAYWEKAEFIPFNLGEMESIALAAIKESLDAYLQKDLQLTERACLREPQLDAIYQEKLTGLRQKMKEDPQHITCLLYWYTVMKYLEKICDHTLNIGEQAIFLITGRRLKFSQYQQLDRLVSPETSLKYSFYPYYDGISGAVVARMDDGQGMVLYKEGNKKKIAAEADKLLEWQKVSPSLTPRVITTTIQGDRETLLREFVAGDLLSDLYLSDGNIQEKEEATRILFTVVVELWGLTLKEEKPVIDYVDQIRSRLGEVYAMHPYLEYLAGEEGLDILLDAAKERETSLSPSFSVWLHGDFNINNVVCHKGQVRFIDVHRSHYGDYLTDAGVFMVSTVRQPHLRDKVCQDMERVRSMVMDAIGSFARARKDENFSSRLNLSLARSYITSSRVVVDEPHARWLFEQGVNLLKWGVSS